MGSEVCADEQVIVECGNWKLISKVVTVGAGDEEEDEAASASAAAGPATPDPVENGEHHNLNLNLNLSLNHHHFSPPPSPWGNHSGLQTPKETLFDSFAPASDKFLLAPHHRKYREESRNHVVRRLDFTKDLTNTWSCKEEAEEEHLFEIVYGTIMDTILAEQQQVKDAAADGSGGGGGTPKSAPFLNGFAETCPAAPIKSARKHRFIDREICKKLDF